jgi:hypothetical protein
VRRRWLFPGFFAFIVVSGSPAAYALGPVEDAAAEAPSARVPASPTPMTAPTPAPSTSERPPRGPALRERSGRRSRGASTASGVLMLVMLIAFMGYYVVKKLRR